MMSFKSVFGFTNKVRVGPDYIDVYWENDSGGLINEGDWVAVKSEGKFQHVAAVGNPAPISVLGALTADITDKTSGWVRVWGKLANANVNTSVAAQDGLTLSAGNAGRAFAYTGGVGEWRCGIALTAEVGNQADVWIG